MADAEENRPYKRMKSCGDDTHNNEPLPIFNLKYEKRDLQEVILDIDVTSYVGKSLVYPFNVHCMLCMKTCSTEMSLFMHMKSSKHLTLQLKKKEAIGIMSKEFNTFIMCCLSDLIAFVHVYYKAHKLNEIVVANKELIFSENTTNILPEEAETTSNIIVNSPGFIPPVVKNTVFFRVIVDREDSKVFKEGRAATYSHLTGNIVVKAKASFSHKISYLYELFTEGIPSSGPLFIDIFSWCSENIPFSTFVWCYLCSKDLTMGSLTSHLSSEEHNSSECSILYGLMCHKCETFFLISQGKKINHVHSRDAFKKTIKDQTIKKFKSIHLMLDTSKESIDMYVNDFAKKYSVKKTDFRFQCLLCTTNIFSFQEDFNSHLNDSSHLDKSALEKRKFIAFCDACNTMLFTPHENRILGHFESHDSPNEVSVSITEPSTSSTSTSINVILEPESSTDCPSISDSSIMFPEVAHFSRTSFQITDPGIQDDFIITRDFTSENIEEYIAETFYSIYSDIKKLYFSCLNCSFAKMNKDIFYNHLKNTKHLAKMRPYEDLIFLVKICDICQVFLLASHVDLLVTHFTSHEHNSNVKHKMDFIRMEYIEKSGKIKLGWSGKLTKKSKDLFSSQYTLNKCIETALKEADDVTKSIPFIHGMLKRDIRLSLEPIYGTIDLQFFGSRIYGLAQQNSDVDICLNLEQVTVEDLQKEFSKSSSLFNVKETITSALVPIIRLKHIYTSLDCDISCSGDSTSACNSELIKVYISLDDRVPWVLMAVREWASANQIRGTKKFTSFSLIWLALFFLMQPDICLIPPANLLKEIYQGEKKIIKGWNYSFSKDVELIKVHHNPLACTKSKYELLFLFFNYYAMLNGKRVMLVPLTGEVYPRSAAFNADCLLYPELVLNEEDTEPIKVGGQYILLDCFRLKRNKLKSIDENLADHFRLICKKTCEDCSWMTTEE